MKTAQHNPTVRKPDCKGMHRETEAICTLVNTGMDVEDAYKMIKPKKELTRANKHELKRKANALALQDPKRVKAAQKAIDQILAGKVVGDAKTVNTSDILAAVKMVADRVDPIVNQSLNINVNAEISPVDLSAYLNMGQREEETIND